MGFESPKDNEQWAIEKGIMRTNCSRNHRISYNSSIGCPECSKEDAAKKKELREQGKQALEQFDLKFKKKKRWPWSK